MTTTLSLYHGYNLRLAALLAGACAVLALSYGVFLLLAMERTAARADAENSAHDLSASLSALEGEYLALEKQLGLAQAAELGLSRPKASRVTYVRIETPALTLVGGY